MHEKSDLLEVNKILSCQVNKLKHLVTQSVDFHE